MHFLINITNRDVPDALNGQHLRLCWDAHGGTEGKRFSASNTPAALLSDDGWVMHGMLKADEAKRPADEAVSVEKAASDFPGIWRWTTAAAGVLAGIAVTLQGAVRP